MTTSEALQILAAHIRNHAVDALPFEVCDALTLAGKVATIEHPPRAAGCDHKEAKYGAYPRRCPSCNTVVPRP